MKRTYEVAEQGDKRGLAEFLKRESQFLLPMVELVERTELAIDEVITVMGRATLEAVLAMSAEGVAGPKLDRSIRGESPSSDLSELLEPSGQRGVIGDRELDVEQVGQGTQEALGLAKRKVKDHAVRQRGFDRDVRVCTLAAGFATSRSSPGIERGIGEPDGQVSSSP